MSGSNGSAGGRWLPWAATAAFGLWIAFHAWVSEDTFITFRTIDNAVHGYGLRWNVDERVQTYTHPLWMLVNLPVYALVRDAAWTVTLVALVCSTAAFALLAARTRALPPSAALTLLAFAFLSRSLTLYSTSGFENPLGHLLLASFATVALRPDPMTPRRLGLLVCLACLSAVNRLDTALLFAPALALEARAACMRRGLAAVAWGALPLAAWLAFAFAYYGQFSPNTKFSKLSPTIPLAEYARHGAEYVGDLALRDPAAAAVLVAATGATALLAWRLAGGLPASAARRARLGLGLGSLVYGAYVIAVGGCFLSGRFWTLPLFAGLFLLADGADDRDATRPLDRPALPLVAGLLLVLAARLPLATALDGRKIMALPRARLTLTATGFERSEIAEDYYQRGLDFRRRAATSPARTVELSPQIGLTGLTAGPRVRIVDRYGIGDPLIARLPAAKETIYRVGHLARAIPRGYERARTADDPSLLEPPLDEVWTLLRTAQRAPLWSAERWRAVRALHDGTLTDLLAEYEPRPRR